MIHHLTLGKRCISTIELLTTKEDDWKECNKLEEDNIIYINEVMKVNGTSKKDFKQQLLE